MYIAKIFKKSFFFKNRSNLLIAKNKIYIKILTYLANTN